jgi:hypothetical protein
VFNSTRNLGIKFEKSGKCVVVRVDRGTQADKLGLMVGMLLISVNAVDVDGDAMEVVRPIFRTEQTRSDTITLTFTLSNSLLDFLQTNVAGFARTVMILREIENISRILPDKAGRRHTIKPTPVPILIKNYLAEKAARELTIESWAKSKLVGMRRKYFGEVNMSLEEWVLDGLYNIIARANEFETRSQGGGRVLGPNFNTFRETTMIIRLAYNSALLDIVNAGKYYNSLIEVSGSTTIGARRGIWVRSKDEETLDMVLQSPDIFSGFVQDDGKPKLGPVRELNRVLDTYKRGVKDLRLKIEQNEPAQPSIRLQDMRMDIHFRVAHAIYGRNEGGIIFNQGAPYLLEDAVGDMYWNRWWTVAKDISTDQLGRLGKILDGTVMMNELTMEDRTFFFFMDRAFRVAEDAPSSHRIKHKLTPAFLQELYQRRESNDEIEKWVASKMGWITKGQWDMDMDPDPEIYGRVLQLLVDLRVLSISDSSHLQRQRQRQRRPPPRRRGGGYKRSRHKTKTKKRKTKKRRTKKRKTKKTRRKHR